MAKFNKKGTKPLTKSFATGSSVADGLTGNQAPAYSRDAKTELFLMAVGSFFGESTFYERDFNARYRELSSQIAIEDPLWLKHFVRWLRKDEGIRTAPIAIALDGVKARIAAKQYGQNRQLIGAALQRGDEPAEAFSYWFTNYGKPAAMSLKRAVADWFENNLNEYQYLKYGDSRYGNLSHRDLIRLTHPNPKEAIVNQLIAYIVDPENVEAPSRVKLQKAIFSGELENPTPEDIRQAGITWQQWAGFTGVKPDWNLLIPSMGYQALLMNLRNFEEAGIKNPDVTARLADPVEVRRSRMFPFRFLAAYNELKTFFYTPALEEALNVSVDNVPRLRGNTLILVDQSGSMGQHMSKHSKTNYTKTAALFGAVLARAAENATLVFFGGNPHSSYYPQYKVDYKIVDYTRWPLLRLVTEEAEDMGGTKTRTAFEASYVPNVHDRIVLITDEQYNYGEEPSFPKDVPVYIWNVVGYKYGHGIRDNIHVFGGLSDKGFKLIQLIEAGRNANWPWEQES